MNRVIEAIRRVAEPEPTDGQLLSAYACRGDGDAFAELVRRHGPMVWGVCRRMLANHADAEDAFQATFLVLVRKPGSVRPAERVGNWLHGVAVHAARKAARSAARRRERQVEALPEPETVAEGVWHDLVPVLDEEVTRLPEKYRLPVVLCDLEGCTRREAAERLGWPEGTVAGRLALGRAALARRLNGLQAGVAFAPGQKGRYRVGDTATLVVYLRNVSGKELLIEYTDAYLAENQPTVLDAAGKPVATSPQPSLRGVWRLHRKTLAAGEVMELGRVERLLEPARDVVAGTPTVFVGPGKYKLSYIGVPPGGLSTGSLDLEVGDPPGVAWGAPVMGSGSAWRPRGRTGCPSRSRMRGRTTPWSTWG
jgi:RNA polymerase sigma factor (sigma-70 family)